MGWEQRAGRFYFYEKRREGRRVFSRCVGGGALAFVAGEMIAESGQERLRQCQAQEKIRHEQKQLDNQLAAAEATIAGIVRAALQINIVNEGGNQVNVQSNARVNDAKAGRFWTSRKWLARFPGGVTLNPVTNNTTRKPI